MHFVVQKMLFLQATEMIIRHYQTQGHTERRNCSACTTTLHCHEYTDGTSHSYYCHLFFIPFAIVIRWKCSTVMCSRAQCLAMSKQCECTVKVINYLQKGVGALERFYFAAALSSTVFPSKSVDEIMCRELIHLKRQPGVCCSIFAPLPHLHALFLSI